MNDLIATLAQTFNLDPNAAQGALGAVLGFLQNNIDPSAFQNLVNAVPGGQDLLASIPPASEVSGGLMGMLGGLMGESGGGLMALATQLSNHGISMDQLPSFAQELLGYLRTHAGDAAVNDAMAQVPALSSVL
jgi:Protein of unknown function VcgC/VcgE (DUF2780)